MYYAYVLNSVNHTFYYKGHCFDLEERLDQHNAGMTKSIRPYIHFEIAHFETFHTEVEAIAREKNFNLLTSREKTFPAYRKTNSTQ